jgi:hypothetical protein
MEKQFRKRSIIKHLNRGHINQWKEEEKNKFSYFIYLKQNYKIWVWERKLHSRLLNFILIKKKSISKIHEVKALICNNNKKKGERVVR